jgi:hypothetical protein
MATFCYNYKAFYGELLKAFVQVLLALLVGGHSMKFQFGTSYVGTLVICANYELVDSSEIAFWNNPLV